MKQCFRVNYKENKAVDFFSPEAQKGKKSSYDFLSNAFITKKQNIMVMYMTLQSGALICAWNNVKSVFKNQLVY